MKTIFIMLGLWLAISLSHAHQTNAERLSLTGNLERLAFGSCSKQYEKQFVWKDLIEQAPDLFIWGGDNIYANSNSPEKILAAYRQQNNVEDYKFFKMLTPIIGTWDDHDYGNNNEDGNFSIKKISREYALEFLEEPLMSPRRLRDGLYESYNFGEIGKKIKIILLDNRYFKNLETQSPLLGGEQWNWLQNEIHNSDADLHLVVSGLSILSPQNKSAEEWADYPSEKEKLKTLLRSKNIPYLYLTGDKHFASIFQKKKELEFMASGMTHNTKLPMRPYVRAKFPDPVFINNYGLIDFAWDNTSPILTLTIRTAFGQIMTTKKVRWEDHQWKEI
jgi:alkaline phosphatase D